MVGYDLNDVSQVTANYNDLSGNGTGVSTTVQNVDATCNWWGSGDAYTVQSNTDGPVQFLPYWTTSSGPCDGLGPVKVYDTEGGTLLSSHMTILDGINASSVGNYITIAAGNYIENINLPHYLSLVGDGSGVTTITGSGGTVMQLAAGMDATNRMVLTGIKLTGGTTGLTAGSYTTLTDVVSIQNTSYGINLNPLTDLVITNCSFNENNVGLKLASTASATYITITGSHFDDNIAHGWYSDAKDTSEPDLDVVNISNTTFNDNGYKGMYTERLSHAIFDGVTCMSSGDDPAYNWGAGIDINLKWKSYSDITIKNSSFTGCGVGSLNGVGLTVKARDDGGTYGANPATLDGVTIDNVTFNGNERGLALGEPGKDNAGPTNVEVKNCTFSGSVLMDIYNNSISNVVAKTGNVYVGASTNFDIEDRIYHALDLATAGYVNIQDYHVFVTINTLGIQRGIDVANPGYQVNVNSGSYTGNLVVDKKLDLIATYGAGTTTVNGSGGNAISIVADDVKIDGFTITNPSGTSAIYSTDNSDIIISDNIITDIGTTAAKNNVQALAIVSSNEVVDNILIENNILHNINMTALSSGNGASAKAIAVGWSTGAFDITNLTIQSNIIYDVNSNIDPWPAGHGAYGIILNHGTGTTGKTDTPNILNNEISDLEGLWSHGIGLEGNTPNAVVQNNMIDNLIDYKVEKDAAAIMIEDNASAATVDISINSFTNVDAGVRNVTGISVDITCDWFGSTDPSAIADLIDGPVNVVSYLTNGTDDQLATIGFQPVAGSCGGVLPVYNVTQSLYYPTIQTAVDDANPNDEITVAAGTYVEQVVITTEGLKITGAGSGTGAGATIIQAPANMPWFFTTSANNYPIVGIDGVANITMENLTVDGNGQGNTNYRFIGIGLWNAGGTFNYVDVTGVRDEPLSGNQHGVGMYAYNNTGGPYVIDVNGMSMDDFQKNGFALYGTGLTANLDNIYVTGAGDLGPGDPAQNGIAIGYGAGGSISNSSIMDINYNDPSWAAMGIQILSANPVEVDYVAITNCQTSIYYEETSGIIKNCTIANPSNNVWGDGIVIWASGAKSASGKSEKLKVSAFEEKVDLFKDPKAVALVDIDDCIIQGVDRTDSRGIDIYDATVDIDGCTIINWDYAIAANDGGISSLVVSANGNWLPDNNFGFWTDATVAQDAKDNYWGEVSPGTNNSAGPFHLTNNSCGDGSQVSDNVDFYEWWADYSQTTRYAYPTPTLTCPTAITKERYEERGPYALGEATGASTCYNPVEITFEDDLAGLTGCNNTGTFTRTWKITDFLGQELTCVQVITVEDNTAPVVFVPDDINTENGLDTCGTKVFFEVTAGDLTYHQGFENSAWVSGFDWKEYQSEITRVTSGTNGITSSEGAAHGEITTPVSASFPGAYTFQGGGSDDFGVGFFRRLDVYFDLTDPGLADETYGWEVSGAAARQTGSHLRDYIFHAAGYPGKIAVGANNNSNFSRDDVIATFSNYYEVTISDWYTLEWVYRDSLGSLAVDCNLLDALGNKLWTETRYNPADDIATTVGGHYYMWFTYIEPDFLAIDNGRLYYNVEPIGNAPLTNGDIFPVGTTLVTSTATDACGNIGNDTFNVTVEDTQPPDAICQNIDVYLDATGSVSIVATDVDNGSSDNCAIDTYAVSQDAFSCDDIGPAVPVVLTVTDIHGNISTCNAEVTVLDAIAPTITCPGDQEVCADETATDTYTISGTEFDWVTSNDNCSIEDYLWKLEGATTAVFTSGITLDGVVLNAGVTTITWTATDQSNNTSAPCSFDVTVNPLPNPVISGNQTVVGGSTEVYQTAYVAGHTYAWTVTGAVNVVVNPSPNDYICEVVWGASGTGTVAVTETVTATGCDYTTADYVVTINPVALQGTITYKNNSATPMNNVNVRLLDGSMAIVATATTDATGHYAFNNVANGNYTLQVETAKNWGGGNSTDALAIQRTALNYTFPWWTPSAFVNNVGDVNASGNLSSLDALKVKQRTVYLINSFTAGDWAFWNSNGAVNFTNTAYNIANLSYTHSGTTTLNIKAMCYGDVNGSYLPASSKSLLAIQSQDELEVLEDNEFQLPVKIIGDHEIGAMSIFLSYPENLLEVVDLKTTIPGLLYQIEDGWINVAWSDMQPITIPSGGTLFTLVCSADKEVNDYGSLFYQSSETQFANLDCKVLEGVNLNISKINVKYKDNIEGLGGMYAINCFPNPVKDMLNIAYTLPESGQVKITFINSLGDEITTLVNDPQDAGNYNLQFNPGNYGLATGVYYCRMLVEGENSTYNEVIRVVYLK
ncbi:MAG: carboxypeptidase regulatory-like domain-containing protein [Bacteroidales bacterium]|nr:carboxypeptidase regulatory-like domain-containing protein [Bacteroidales bacterium]MCF8405653.1 carboxypeptidase regulatory-like domain-containing protein [Bacteroidales bacterium]